MTIKEMAKVYKKVEKANKAFMDAKISLDSVCFTGDMVTCNVAAKLLAKTSGAIVKIANALEVSTHTLIANALSEDVFIRWIVKNDIEWHGEQEEQDEQEEQELEA